jgi:hypothetical protein
VGCGAVLVLLGPTRPTRRHIAKDGILLNIKEHTGIEEQRPRDLMNLVGTHKESQIIRLLPFHSMQSEYAKNSL